MSWQRGVLHVMAEGVLHVMAEGSVACHGRGECCMSWQAYQIGSVSGGGIGCLVPSVEYGVWSMEVLPCVP